MQKRLKKSTSQRSSKFETDRSPDPDFVPGEQHIRILEHIWQYDMLTENQVMTLEGVKYRRVHQLMQSLFNNGYVNKPHSKIRARYDYMFWVLSRKGARLVANRFGIEYSELAWQREPRWNQVEHDVSVTNFHLALITATRALPDFGVDEFITDTQFRSWQDRIEYVTLNGNKQRVSVYPDALAVITREEAGKTSFYRLMLESERSDKTNPRFVDQKILSRLAYLQSEIYRQRFHTNKGAIAILCRSEEKMHNYRKKAAEVLSKVQARSFFFSLRDDVTAETVLFEPIWWHPGSEQPVPLF